MRTHIKTHSVSFNRNESTHRPFKDRFGRKIVWLPNAKREDFFSFRLQNLY